MTSLACTKRHKSILLGTSLATSLCLHKHKKQKVPGTVVANHSALHEARQNIPSKQVGEPEKVREERLTDSLAAVSKMLLRLTVVGRT
jgi:hypothetical protein